MNCTKFETGRPVPFLPSNWATFNQTLQACLITMTMDTLYESSWYPRWLLIGSDRNRYSVYRNCKPSFYNLLNIFVWACSLDVKVIDCQKPSGNFNHRNGLCVDDSLQQQTTAYSVILTMTIHHLELKYTASKVKFSRLRNIRLSSPALHQLFSDTTWHLGEGPLSEPRRLQGPREEWIFDSPANTMQHMGLFVVVNANTQVLHKSHFVCKLISKLMYTSSLIVSLQRSAFAEVLSGRWSSFSKPKKSKFFNLTTSIIWRHLRVKSDSLRILLRINWLFPLQMFWFFLCWSHFYLGENTWYDS